MRRHNTGSHLEPNIHRSVLSGIAKKRASSEEGQIQGLHSEKAADTQRKTLRDVQKAWVTASL